MAADTGIGAEAGVRRRAVPAPRTLVAAVLTGAVLGAAAGLGIGTHSGAQRAVALLDLSDALSATLGSAPSTDQANRFIQSELLYLNSTTFRRAVEDRLHPAEPISISSAQVGNTDVVQVVGEAADGPDAVRAADGAVAAYDEHRRAAFTARAIDLQQQLAAAERALTAAGANGGPLQDRVSTLQAQLEDARLAADAQGVGGTVVQSAADAGYHPTLSRTVAILAGAAVGALLGLLLLVPRLLSRRVWQAADCADLGVAVVEPVLPAGGRSWLARLADRPSDDRLETAARLLAARLGAHSAGNRPLVLAGAAPGMGTSFAAVNLATALARRRPTVLVAAGDVAGGRLGEWLDVPPGRPGLERLVTAGTPAEVEAALHRTGVEGLRLLPATPAARWEPVEAALPRAVELLLGAGWAVVVDCPPADRSAAAAELARLRPHTAVVATAGRLTPAALAAAVEAVAGADAEPPAVLLTDAPRRNARRPAAPLPAPAPARAAEPAAAR